MTSHRPGLRPSRHEIDTGRADSLRMPGEEPSAWISHRVAAILLGLVTLGVAALAWAVCR